MINWLASYVLIHKSPSGTSAAVNAHLFRVEQEMTVGPHGSRPPTDLSLLFLAPLWCRPYCHVVVEEVGEMVLN